MSGVLGQATEAHLHVTELALDHSKRVLDLRSHLCLGLLDLALGFVQGAAFIELLVGAAACCDLPDHFAASMFGALFDAGVADLDGPRRFVGRAQGGQIVFVRDGVVERIRAGDGEATGMKWLLDKQNCLTVRSGEGYCRD